MPSENSLAVQKSETLPIEAWWLVALLAPEDPAVSRESGSVQKEKIIYNFTYAGHLHDNERVLQIAHLRLEGGGRR